MANYNSYRVKINRTYTFGELARVLGVHKNTVANWVKGGLPCLKEQRPFLILGAEARTFLQQRQAANKQPCKPDELFCMRCKEPAKPAGNYVEYQPMSATRGRLTGFCGRCESLVNKFVGVERLVEYSAIFSLSMSKALEHINDCDNPLLNSDLKR